MRFYHREFMKAYYRAFATFPPRDFMEAYDDLAEEFFFGVREGGPVVIRSGRTPGPYEFNRPSLLRPKGKCDALLAGLAEALGPFSRGGPT